MSMPLPSEEVFTACEIHFLNTIQQIMSFNNKTFVVTGGNSGIGFDTARYLAQEGAKVYLTGRNAELVAKAVSEIGHKVVGVVANAASIPDSVKLAETIAANGDKLDG